MFQLALTPDNTPFSGDALNLKLHLPLRMHSSQGCTTHPQNALLTPEVSHGLGPSHHVLLRVASKLTAQLGVVHVVRLLVPTTQPASPSQTPFVHLVDAK